MIYRWLLLGAAFAVAAAIFLQQFEYVFVPCSSACAKVRAWPLSDVVSIAAVLAVLGLIHLQAVGSLRLFAILSWVCAAAGVGLLFVMVSIGGACYLCLALDGLFLGLALSSGSQKVLLVASVLPVAFTAFILGAALYARTVVPLRVEFVVRHYEPPLDRSLKEFVIFSDPTCPACRTLARAEVQATAFHAAAH